MSDASISANKRAARESLFLSAIFETSGSSVSGRIRNISATGALLETSENLAIDDHIVISFRGVDRMPAVVKRRGPKGYGILFKTEIDPSVCKQSILASKPDPSKDFVLNLREGYIRPIWDNSGEIFRRPATNTKTY